MGVGVNKNIDNLIKDLARHIANEVFKIGSESRKPCTRIEFKSGNLEGGTEKSQGGLCKAALKYRLVIMLRNYITNR